MCLPLILIVIKIFLEMGYESFGGEEFIKKIEGEVQKIEKNHNAYILIY